MSFLQMVFQEDMLAIQVNHFWMSCRETTHLVFFQIAKEVNKNILLNHIKFLTITIAWVYHAANATLWSVIHISNNLIRSQVLKQEPWKEQLQQPMPSADWPVASKLDQNLMR